MHVEGSSGRSSSSRSREVHVSWTVVRASAYLIDTREDGHEAAEYGRTDAGNVDKGTL